MSRLEELFTQLEENENISKEFTSALRNEIEKISRKNTQSYGLVFERKDREYFEVWNTKPSKGDLVKTIKRQDDKKNWSLSKEIYTVLSRKKDTLYLINAETFDSITNKPITNEQIKNITEKLLTINIENTVLILPSDDNKYYYGLRKIDSARSNDYYSPKASCPPSKEKTPEHVIIDGENYMALKALTYTHPGKIDCIFIDPPYNTGAKDWKYNDNYVDNNDQYRHSKWLNFMERRLLLAKELLNQKESVLIMTLDENEVHNAVQLLEQVFATKRIQVITSVVTQSKANNNGMLGKNHEYVIIVYIGDSKAKHLDYNLFTNFPGEEAENQEITYISLLMGQSSFRINRPNLFYPIFFEKGTTNIVSVGESVPLDYDYKKLKAPEGQEILWPIHPNGKEGQWRLQPSRLRKILNTDLCFVTRSKLGKQKIKYLTSGIEKEYHDGDVYVDNSKIPYKAYRRKRKMTPLSVWNNPSHQSRYGGTKLTEEILGDKRFPYPKSLYYIEDILRFFISDKKDATILDFFAGSGTTAHAVMRLNQEDGGQRKSISITVNSLSEREEKDFIKKGITPRDKEWIDLGIAHHVTFPRLKAAILGKTAKSNYETIIPGNYKYNLKTLLSDGFKDNVSLYELTYNKKDTVEEGYSFNHISPLLMIKSGQLGNTINKEDIVKKGYHVNNTHAVIFDLGKINECYKEIEKITSHKNHSFKHLYIFSHDNLQYQLAAKHFPNLKVIRLYESLEINR